jgi:gamma-glutamyltranspeptidase
MKKPMVLNGSGEAPKAVPRKLAAKAFQPRLNSPPAGVPGTVAGVGGIALWFMLASIPPWE